MNAPDHAADPRRDPAAPWTRADSEVLYGIPDWGHGYFAADDRGHLVVRPERSPRREIDLLEVVEGLIERDLHPPFLIRFSDLLDHRLLRLHEAFADAMRENDYRGRYVAVYPIKVNQQRPVVQEIFRYGAPYGFGLEVGSKPELLVVMALSGEAPDRPIICNGFKDDSYIEAVILAGKLGRTIVPVIEAREELDRVLRYARRHDVRPSIGVRVKLATPGSGRWSESTGHKSKFGLYVNELLELWEVLHAEGMGDCLKLLHCHAGSQIRDIRTLKAVVAELSQVYGELAELGAGLEYIDVGGGLGVDYDGTRSAGENSINYTLAEYASEVVYRVAAMCNERDLPHPTIISESGRAIASFQSVLVFNTLGASGPEHSFGQLAERDLEDDPELPGPIRDLLVAHSAAEGERLVESYHDALQARDQAADLFTLGYLNLRERARSERLFWAIVQRVRQQAAALPSRPEELTDIDGLLSDTYFCNLSVFQSLPDAWAIGQRFPILPIQRLDEEPTRRAVLADITCDSDGKLDAFIGEAGGLDVLPVHPLRNGEPYYLGAFLVGAYQETLGDLHNLFGDTHAVHIRLLDDGRWWIEELIPGDTARAVLGYVQYDVDRLLPSVRGDCERAVREDRMTVAQSQALQRFYERALGGYTYLEPDRAED